ncbi:MAG: glycogen/starch synthase [Cyclobacteriaceae bacterium]
MKVLTFGWEFPPHISGGLGAACFGLTQSLVKLNVKILLVVPRLYGDETAEGSVLINASTVRCQGLSRVYFFPLI